MSSVPKACVPPDVGMHPQLCDLYRGLLSRRPPSFFQQGRLSFSGSFLFPLRSVRRAPARYRSLLQYRGDPALSVTVCTGFRPGAKEHLFSANPISSVWDLGSSTHSGRLFERLFLPRRSRAFGGCWMGRKLTKYRRALFISAKASTFAPHLVSFPKLIVFSHRRV